MSNDLNRHKRSDTVKWVIIFLLVIGIIGAVVALFVQMDRQTTVTTIGPEAYSVGALDEAGEQTDADTSIVTRDAFTTDGLKVELADDATVTYELFFYDADGKFISSTGALSSNFSVLTMPLNAEMAKIVITPTEDEDGTVSLTEVWGYADQITVTTDR